MFCFFVGCNKNLTGKEVKITFFHFSRDEKRRSNVNIKARIQPDCIANNIYIWYINGKEVYPRSVVTETYKSLRSWNNHSCLTGKSDGVSSSKTLEEKKSKTTKKLFVCRLIMLKVFSNMNIIKKELGSQKSNFIYAI